MVAKLSTWQIYGVFMADIKHRNSIRIATTTMEREAEAIEAIKTRELLYNRNNKTLGIILEDEDGVKYRQIVSGLVDEVNITKNEKYETKLKEDIIIDSVTTQADHEGVDWKSQSKIAETDAANTVLLLFKQDNENNLPAVIGGEILEVGPGIFGHYQVSLTQTGSRLIKGATTYAKKAKFVLAMYNGERYYGIKFKSELAANIYFAGWQSVDESLLAPAYTEYEDSDLSDIIELDDDSDTGTQVVEYKFLTYKDLNWEFIGDKAPDFNGNPTTSGAGVDTMYDWGNGLTMYPYQGNKSEVRIETRWQSVVISGTDALVWKVVVDHDGADLTMYVKNWIGNRSCNLVLYADDGNGNPIYKTVQNQYIAAGAQGNSNSGLQRGVEVTFTNLQKGTYWIRQGDGGQATQVEYYTVSVFQDFSENAGSWDNGRSNIDFDLGDGLMITTDQDITYNEGTRFNNTGYFTVSGRASVSAPLATLKVVGPCTITVGVSRYGSNESNFRITETLDTKSEGWNKSVSEQLEDNSITYVTYKYEGPHGTIKDIYFINETNGCYWYNVNVDYPDLNGQGDIIAQLILGLGDTGEDGSPHIIRLNGTITRASLITIAQSIRDNSNKQIVLDLSKCTMEAGYEDWGADDGDQYGRCLNSLFHNCVGLREFYFPHNVTATGAGTFQNCSFLRKLVLNPEMLYVGGKETWAFSNNAWLAGCRMKTLLLPKSVKGLGSYWAADSNLINVYIEEGSAFLQQGNVIYRPGCHWCCFPNTKEDLRFFLTDDMYNYWYNLQQDSHAQTFSGLGASEDKTQNFFIHVGCYLRDHIEHWDGIIEELDYQA